MEGERNTDGAGLKLAVHLFNSIKEGMVMCLLLFYITYFFLIFYICLMIYAAPWCEARGG